MSDLNNTYEELNKHWLKYITQGWISSNCPEGLYPELAVKSPLTYDNACIAWLEEHFNQYFFTLNDLLCPPHGRLIQTFSESFSKKWMEVYQGPPLWRQLVVFLAFAESVAPISEETLQVSEMYSLSLGISSMGVDKASDVPNKSIGEFFNSIMFAVIALLQGLLWGRNNKRIEHIVDRLMVYTKQMLEIQWKEIQNYYLIPKNLTDNNLEKYLIGPSRLNGAIFFPLAAESAYITNGIQIPELATRLGNTLSRLRQLNDEIVDIEEDIKAGIITFPFLHALITEKKRGIMKNLINKIWKEKEILKNNRNQPKMSSAVYEILHDNGSLEATAIESIKLLQSCAHMVMGLFEPSKCFSLCILINQRLAHLTRLKENRWREIQKDRIRQPFSMN